jgi:uncharacterized repeat protein (TIGR01451 family)
MAIFTNFATLSYNGGSATSNTVIGEIQEAVSATKTAVTKTYGDNTVVTYVVSLINSSASAVSGLTLTDDLGAYSFGGANVYPLEYTDGSVLYYVNGLLNAPPAVTAGPPLVISGISVPAGGNATIVYETTVTDFAPLAAGSIIDNVVTITGSGLTSPVTASEIVSAVETSALNITKAVSPSTVAPNGLLTYTFLIENTGNQPVVATDDLILSDNFDPILTGIVVTLDGTVLTLGKDYTYDEATGAFATVAGRITVPAATYTQNPDGSWVTTPGTAFLSVRGTV